MSLKDLTIELLDASKKEAYKNFVKTCPHAMLYHGWEYKELIKELLNVQEHYMLAIDEEGKITGVLPMLYKQGPYGDVYNSLPFYGSNGGILTNEPGALDFLLKEYNHFISENKSLISSTIISNPLKPEESYESIVKNFTDYRIGQFSNIDFKMNHEEELMKMFHYKTRNMVRKGMNEGIKVDVNNNAIDFIIDTHEKNMAAIGGKAKPDKFFENFPRHFKADSDYKIYIASLNGQPIAALLLFYFNNTVEYYTPVIIEAFRDKQPLSVLVYKAMTEASLKGFTRWNWGGTWASQGGVYTFKKRWGTYDINYYYHTLLKDENLLEKSKEDLLQNYDNFFVIAFDKLKTPA